MAFSEEWSVYLYQHKSNRNVPLRVALYKLRQWLTRYRRRLAGGPMRVPVNRSDTRWR